MPREVKDPYLIAELNDRRDAAEAGLDYDKISRSRQYKRTLRENVKSGQRLSGFSGARGDSEGGVGQSIFKGAIGDLAEGANQLITRGINRAQKAIGLDPNQDILGRGEGQFSDAAVDYADAQARIGERQFERARKRKGRTGTDVARIAGNFIGPNFVPGGGGRGVLRAAGSAAAEGAVQGALQPVRDTRRGYARQKAADVALGGAVSGVLGGGLAVPGAVGRQIGRRAADVAENVERGARQGLDLSLAEASPSRGIRQLQDISANTIVGGSIPAKAQDTLERFSGRVQDIGDTIAGGRDRGTSAFTTGNTVQRGLNRFTDRFRAQSRQLYDAVDAHVPRNARVPMLDTIEAMQGPRNAFVSNPELGQALANRKMTQFARILGDPIGTHTLTFPEAQRLRSEVGRMMGEPELLNMIPRAELSRVYSTLTDSMRGSIEDAPHALQAFDRASNYYRAGRSRIDNVIEPLMNRPSGESMVKTLQNMVGTNARGIAALRRSMEPGEWDEVAGYMFRNLGQETAGRQGAEGTGFNPVKFLTDYNKLRQNPEAFDFAFGGTRYSQLADTYDDLARLSENMQRTGDIANKSRSGYTTANYALMGSLFGIGGTAAIPGMIAGAAPFYLTAKALSSPRIARQVARIGRNYMRNQNNPRQLNRYLRTQIPKLAAIQATEDEVEQEY